MIDPIMHIELKGQVDELSLKVKQQCIVPSDVHFYENKFWNYIVTLDAGQIKEVMIYDRSIFNFFEDAVIGEHDALHIINSSSITTVKLQGASSLPLPVCITFIFTAKQGKLSHAFRIIPQIIPFD